MLTDQSKLLPTLHANARGNAPGLERRPLPSGSENRPPHPASGDTGRASVEPFPPPPLPDREKEDHGGCGGGSIGGDGSSSSGNACGNVFRSSSRTGSISGTDAGGSSGGGSNRVPGSGPGGGSDSIPGNGTGTTSGSGADIGGGSGSLSDSLSGSGTGIRSGSGDGSSSGNGGSGGGGSGSGGGGGDNGSGEGGGGSLQGSWRAKELLFSNDKEDLVRWLDEDRRERGRGWVVGNPAGGVDGDIAGGVDGGVAGGVADGFGGDARVPQAFDGGGCIDDDDLFDLVVAADVVYLKDLWDAMAFMIKVGRSPADTCYGRVRNRKSSHDRGAAGSKIFLSS